MMKGNRHVRIILIIARFYIIFQRYFSHFMLFYVIFLSLSCYPRKPLIVQSYPSYIQQTIYNMSFLRAINSFGHFDSYGYSMRRPLQISPFPQNVFPQSLPNLSDTKHPAGWNSRPSGTALERLRLPSAHPPVPPYRSSSLPSPL